MTKEYKLEIRVKNNLILELLKEKGVTSLMPFCKQNNICYGRLLNIINMVDSPINPSEGTWSKCVIQLCDFLKCSPDQLFTEEQKYIKGISKKELYISEAEAKYYLESKEEPQCLEYQLDHEKLIKEIFPEISNVLTERERSIIKMRFEDEYTYKKCGEILDISTERVRQIESKALRKMRNKSYRIDSIDDFI